VGQNGSDAVLGNGRNGLILGWMKVLVAVMLMIGAAIAYIHTEFMTVAQHNRDQDKIEKQLDEIHADVKELLKRH
jgi:hypothetical protein